MNRTYSVFEILQYNANGGWEKTSYGYQFTEPLIKARLKEIAAADKNIIIDQ